MDDRRKGKERAEHKSEGGRTMNDPQMENQDIERGKMLGDDSRERLTTKDVATGVAAKRAPDKSDLLLDPKENLPPTTKDIGRSGEAVATEPGQAATPLFDDGESKKFRADWLAI